MRRKIGLIGAGKSTSYLIAYLLDKSDKEGILLHIADQSFDQLDPKYINHPNLVLHKANMLDDQQRSKWIASMNLVISMLPARFHHLVARDCIDSRVQMLTASYVSDEIKAMEAEISAKGLLFIFEMGVDPGIDHMSAKQVIDRIKSQGGKMLLFESFTGGLVAPQSDDNLWNYKFTWNPRNVVVAGQGGAAKFLQEGTYKYNPYQKLFRRTEFLDIEGFGKFEAYANRDSLKYQSAYELDDIRTLYRGTIRKVGFSRAWNLLVELGITDDSYHISNSKGMSYRAFTNMFLPYSPTNTVELKLRHYLKIDQDDIVWDKLIDLNLFKDDCYIEIDNGTPAEILQEILSKKWSLKESDKDMIVMYHQFGYELNGEFKQIDASMGVIGSDHRYTAMAKTVGLPLGITAIQMLNNKFNLKGIQIPIHKDIYEIVLKELNEYGIHFKERECEYLGYNPEVIGL